MQEVETKILNIDTQTITETMERFGAKKILSARLSVDWYAPKGMGQEFRTWFLRIRRRSDGVAEVTWKGNVQKTGIVKSAREIHFETEHPDVIAELFLALGLEQYAHQEKDRTSWTYKDWRFDLDQYPNMPAYLEIEGQSEAHIEEAIRLLGLEGHDASPEGERVVIQETYKLNWVDMRF